MWSQILLLVSDFSSEKWGCWSQFPAQTYHEEAGSKKQEKSKGNGLSFLPSALCRKRTLAFQNKLLTHLGHMHLSPSTSAFPPAYTGFESYSLVLGLPWCCHLPCWTPTSLPPSAFRGPRMTLAVRTLCHWTWIHHLLFKSPNPRFVIILLNATTLKNIFYYLP